MGRRQLHVWRTTIAAVLAVALGLSVGQAAPGVKLAAGGRALVTLVVADEPIPAEQTAALELATYLQKITGAACAPVKEAQWPGTGPAIHVGHTAFARQVGVDLAKLGPEEWIIRTVGGSLLITGGRPRGTLFGVYEFLEKHGGCAWLDEDTEIVPTRADWEIADINEQDRPAFWSRSYYSGFTKGHESFHVRNKHVLHSYDAKFGSQDGFGSPGNCHTFYAYCKDWPDKPEYWAFTNGARQKRPSSGSSGQFCLTHPEVRQRVLAQLREYIRKDRERAAQRGVPPPRIYDISHNDGPGYCVCPGCQAVLDREGAYSGVMLDFINEIARGIKDEYPEVLIQSVAYTFTLDPPRHIKPEDNVLMLVCDLGTEWYPVGRSENLRSVLHPDNQHFQDVLKSWSRLARQVAVWDYWKIYQITFPYTNVSHLQPDLRFFRDQRVGRLFVEGEDLENGSFAALKQWLGLKLMQNPDRPAPELIRFFLRGYYGASADTMGEYLAYLEQRIAATPGSFGRVRPTNWKYFTLPFFTRVHALLDRAETLAADTPACLAHVQRERVPVDYALLFMWDELQRTLPAGQPMPFDKQQVLARYERHKSTALRSYYSGDPLTRQLANLADEIRFIQAMPVPVPEQFQGKQVVDLLWPDFPGDVRVNDPEATAGIAVRLGPRPAEPGFHVLPLTMGVYDTVSRKAGPGLSLKQADLAQDGKYHFYKLGTWPIGDQKTYVWVHWTWLIQIYLTKAYQPPLVKTMDIYVSLKAVGPAYVKDSTAENSIYVDRIILVETD